MSDLVFEGVSVRYGHGRAAMNAIDEIDLAVPAGTVVGLVGESGSGKSTLAKAAVGLVPVSAGRITVGGAELQAQPGPHPVHPGPRPVHMVFQDPYSSLDPRMSVGATIAEAIPGRPTAGAARTRVAELLELVELDSDRASALPSQLSGGQRQRVSLARALAAEPMFLLADEMTSALDVSVQGAMLNLLRDLHRRLGLGILFISHNLAVVRYVSDLIAVMYLGRIVEFGTTADVVDAPRHPYTKSLIASVPRLGERLDAVVAGDALEPRSPLDPDPPDPHDPPAGCRFHPRCPIGPLVHEERSVCIASDPRLVTLGGRHHAACHFATASCP